MYTKSGGGLDLQFLDDDMEEFFTPATHARGCRYFEEGRVWSMHFDGDDTIFGTVMGSLKSPYQTEITIDLTNKMIVETYCTCPVQEECKHAVAVLLKFEEVYDNQTIQKSENDIDENLMKFVNLIESTHSDIRKELARNSRDKKHSPLLLSKNSVILYIVDTDTAGELQIEIQSVEIVKNRIGNHVVLPLDCMNRLFIPQLQVEDEKIARFWKSALEEENDNLDNNIRTAIPTNAEAVNTLLKKIIATGRCHYPDKYRSKLKLGPERTASLQWRKKQSGLQKLTLKMNEDGADPAEADADCRILFSSSPWYVYADINIAGPLNTNLNPKALSFINSLPELNALEAAKVCDWLKEKNVQIVPLPHLEVNTTIKTVTPTPRLRLFTNKSLTSRKSKYDSSSINWMELSFDYPGLEKNRLGSPVEKKTILDDEGKNVLIEKPEPANVDKYVSILEQFGFFHVRHHDFESAGKNRYFIARYEGTWQKFLTESSDFESQGWTIDTEPSFGCQILKPEEEWTAQVEKESDWWFSLELGIKVNGKAMPLVPILTSLFKDNPGKISLEEIEDTAVNGNLMIPLDDGNILELPFERVKAMLSILIELYADRKINLLAESVDLPATALAEMLELNKLSWRGGGVEKLRQIGAMLAKMKTIPMVEAPANLNATLRNYQIDGLSFLEYLSQNQLGGILADDMGLGKTVQTLAHLLLQKNAAEESLDTATKSVSCRRTSLVVCPTSVLPNWIKECQKLAPELKVLPLKGPDRQRLFSQIPDYDLIVTTYPLLPRDIDIMRAQNWWSVILDESQYIKNHQTTIAGTVNKLRSNHRICLTGTPVENHLGEVWSQFDFLLPGILGDHAYFKRVFRNPIEKEGNGYVRKILAARLRPFMLRRTKQEVLSELPEKEIIVDTIEIDGKQRDLYEAVRVSMYERVQAEIAKKGILKSQIIILDALLKLRQVCCHPKLLKLDTAKKVNTSAKLDFLVEKLESLVEEGRQILLFSQFTSMLDLIKPELDSRGIEYVELRGDTKDRNTPVETFQAGKVPLFLISLKAGGFGLNLTAADTVIHFDPWWNPAVENQATDRAHRIGQNKKVFVYKLIAEGTIEERMLELQEHKKELAMAIFDPEKAGSLKFDERDIELLFKLLYE